MIFMREKKMAFRCFKNYLKCSHNSLRYSINSQRCLQFSTSEKISSKNDTPVKFTTSKGATVSIGETIGIQTSESKYKPKYENFAISASIAVFLIYFCLLREENDLDEMLKGNPKYSNKTSELLNLKLKLIYCKNNNLPTDAINARIAELEMEELVKSSYAK